MRSFYIAIFSLSLPCFLLPGAAFAQGLLGKPGGLMQQDPKALAFELELLQTLNGVRAKKKLPPLKMDEKLRDFSRRHAKLAATGDPAAKNVDDLIKKQRLAPWGHRLQYAFGPTTTTVLRDLQKDKDAAKSLLDEFARIGIGAFWVPEDKPYFQVVLFFAADLDPMFGKPGLEPKQTDPVMNAATERLKKCYETLLDEDPNVKGDVLFKIIIGDKGQVDDVSFIKTFKLGDFETCTSTIIRQLKFPVPYKGKPVTLNHPMRFRAAHGERRIGRLSAGQIDNAIRMVAPGLRACYDIISETKPELWGTITLALVVEPTGKLKSLDILHDEIGDPTFQGCILGHATKLRFPRPKFGGEVDITYPLHFSPSSFQPKKKKKKK